jgi:hypothetical protein
MDVVDKALADLERSWDTLARKAKASDSFVFLEPWGRLLPTFQRRRAPARLGSWTASLSGHFCVSEGSYPKESFQNSVYRHMLHVKHTTYSEWAYLHRIARQPEMEATGLWCNFPSNLQRRRMIRGACMFETLAVIFLLESLSRNSPDVDTLGNTSVQ